MQKYCNSHDQEFLQYGNIEKEFTVSVGKGVIIHDAYENNIISKAGEKAFDFVISSYVGNFLPITDEKNHIARFEAGSGMHEHFDSSRPNDIATLIYINNNYSGGEIYFPDHNVSIKPNPGDLVCFPDNPDYVHGVRPIIGGARYTIPRWFTRIV